MRCLPVFCLALVAVLAACSAPAPPDRAAPSAAATTAAAPADATLGSPAWHAWVGRSLGVVDAQGHGPDPGSDEWNQAVQRKLGQEAPTSKPGSPQWQQAVDALLRARLPASAATVH